MRPLIQELPEHYRTSPQDAELQRVLSLLAEQAEAGMAFTLDQQIGRASCRERV